MWCNKPGVCCERQRQTPPIQGGAWTIVQSAGYSSVIYRIHKRSQSEKRETALRSLHVQQYEEIRQKILQGWTFYSLHNGVLWSYMCAEGFISLGKA